MAFQTMLAQQRKTEPGTSPERLACVFVCVCVIMSGQRREEKKPSQGGLKPEWLHPLQPNHTHTHTHTL